MSRQEITTLQKNSNVVWMPTALGESHEKFPIARVNQTYYRSQVFTTQVSVNALIAAAYPLLTLATRLCETTKYHDLTHLYQMLLHEMRVFENQAKLKGYRQNLITIACYFLCVLLDETIIQSHWGKAWQHFSLLASFHHEESSKERVFHVMDRLLQHPSRHVEILELVYLCLSFGLKNHRHQNPSAELLEKLDKIYHYIREERGEISQGFLVQAQTPLPFKTRKQQTRLSSSLVMLFSASIATAAYYAFCYGLKLISAPLTQQLAISSGN
jgi:type VI secretion system protein ImpK